MIYYKAEDAEPSEGAANYAEWLEENFKVEPVKDATEAMQIVEDAKKAHEENFQKWMKRFVAE